MYQMNYTKINVGDHMLTSLTLVTIWTEWNILYIYTVDITINTDTHTLYINEHPMILFSVNIYLR